ncbi:hypothetical protein RB195_025376 [Necator americanus]|uniref:YitH/HolE acetyltransferase (GNAT) domain-containing protein n=1 Tax=Necator americanus TaxID=51031 RepID=A0ABR1EU69_NECAM
MQRLNEDDIHIVHNVTSEMWDQLRELVRTMDDWTSHDEAMYQLLPELKNVYPLFALRKSDKYLLGGLAVVVTDVVYCAFYIMRPGVQGKGIGLKMMNQIMHMMSDHTKKVPVVGRSVSSMLDKYTGPPLYAVHLFELYSFTLPKKELLHIFPCSVNSLAPKSTKELNAEQFEKVCAYDQHITGRDRRAFLKDWHSLFFTKGVALFDAAGTVHGLIGASPLLYDGKIFKIGPIFAASRDNACYLLKCITDIIQVPDAKFVTHISTNTSGDWMLKKCRDANIPLTLTGTSLNPTYTKLIYKDPCVTELMFAPMNTPIFFDR